MYKTTMLHLIGALSYFLEKLELLYKKRFPITVANKADLLKLCAKGVIPDEYHGRFHSLRVDGEKIGCQIS